MSLAVEIQQTSSPDQRIKPELQSSRHLLQDTITPYKICVLSLVRLYLEYKSEDEQKSRGEKRMFDDKHHQSTMLLFMQLIKVPDMSLSQLMAMMHSSVPAELTGHFNVFIRDLAEGKPCTFYAFFERLNAPIKDNMGNELTEFTLLNKTSVIGIVVRSMLIAFKMLSLEEVISSVITEFVKYCQDITNKTSQTGSHTSTILPKDPTPSRWQAERRVTQLALMLEQNMRDCGSAASVSEELAQLLKAYPLLHRIHYVKYLNHMRVKEYAGAKESLHRYFDKIAQAGDRLGTKESSIEDFNRCSRYASLNLASLYAHFGHRHLALHSVREAVKLAQETNDKTCLQHALIWLEHLSDVSSLHSSSPALAFWELSVTGCLIKTLQHTSVTKLPQMVFDELAKALSFQTKHVRLPVHNNTKTTSTLSQMMLSASLWNYYGNKNMCNLISHNVLHTDSSEQSVAHCAEVECLALCVLSNQHFYQGKLECAESILGVAKCNFPRPYNYSDIWSRVEQYQLSDNALYHSDIAALSQACDNLAALDPTEAAIRRSRLCTLQGRYQQSLKLLEGILSSDELKSLSLATAEIKSRATLELIHMYIEREDIVNAKKYIRDCLQMTSDHHLMYQHAICQYYTSYVQLMSGNADEAFTIMTQHLPTFLIHGSCYDKGRAQMIYTKCKIARAKSHPTDVLTQVILEGLQVLEQARENFTLCEAFSHIQDVLMYMALLCNMLGDTERRNSYSFQYRQLEQQLPADRAVSQTLIL